MKIHNILVAGISLALFSIHANAAALVGIADPSWDRETTGGFAGWEWWPVESTVPGSGQFDEITPDQTIGAATGATLSQSSSAIGSSNGANTVTGDPGRLTSAGVGTQYQFTITGVAQQDISSIQLQIKHSNFLDADFNEVYSPFTASLDGGLAIGGEKNPNGTTNPENFRWTSSDGGTATGGTGVFFWVYSYLWEGLDIKAGDEYTLTFSSLADTSGFGFSVDTIGLDLNYGTAAVPEPAMATLGMLGLAATFFRRRRPKPAVA